MKNLAPYHVDCCPVDFSLRLFFLETVEYIFFNYYDGYRRSEMSEPTSTEKLMQEVMKHVNQVLDQNGESFQSQLTEHMFEMSKMEKKMEEMQEKMDAMNEFNRVILETNEILSKRVEELEKQVKELKEGKSGVAVGVCGAKAKGANPCVKVSHADCAARPVKASGPKVKGQKPGPKGPVTYHKIDGVVTNKFRENPENPGVFDMVPHIGIDIEEVKSGAGSLVEKDVPFIHAMAKSLLITGLQRMFQWPSFEAFKVGDRQMSFHSFMNDRTLNKSKAYKDAADSIFTKDGETWTTERVKNHYVNPSYNINVPEAITEEMRKMTADSVNVDLFVQYLKLVTSDPVNMTPAPKNEKGTYNSKEGVWNVIKPVISDETGTITVDKSKRRRESIITNVFIPKDILSWIGLKVGEKLHTFVEESN